MPPRSIGDYQVGWVCALPKEMTAARAMLDEEHEPFESDTVGDNNSYVLGRVRKHNVVMACLPAGVYGTNAAATVAVNMLRTFTGLRFVLMVGIGGGIPNLEKAVDIRLGDVVVSQPDQTYGGVVQYDLGKNLGEGKFERMGFLRPPPTMLLTALGNLQSKYDLDGSQIPELLADVIKRRPNLAKSGYGCPGPEKDYLYCSHTENPSNNTRCLRCQDGIIQRTSRDDQYPVVHYGVIASGNELIKNAPERDRLGEELGAKCVEMEAAGLMNEFPCIVIRGICDYADAHKNDVWQKYAATTAAAFAKELLSFVRPAEVAVVMHATDVMKYSLGLNLFDAPDIGKGLFIGRKAELQDMEMILQPQSDSSGLTRQVLILGGMGGIGKTQLAISYAKQCRNSYSSVFWLNATSEATVSTSFRNITHRISPPETVRKFEDDDQLRIHVCNWLSDQDNARWLLIFDNHDEPDRYDITKYYAPRSQGSIIVTTRQPRRLSGEKIKVESMAKREDGVAVLATRSGRHSVEFDPGAQQLAERLDGFPLALATAGAFLKESSVSFSKYLQQYEARWEVIPGETEQLPDYPTRTLYTTWNLSLAQIKERNPQAAQLLQFLAYLGHQDLWYELFSAVQDKERPLWFAALIFDEFVFEKAMNTLIRYCLVETHPQTGSYSLHVCVHDWTLNGLNRYIDVDQYWLAVDCVTGPINDVQWNDLAILKYRRFNSHAERLTYDRFQEVVKQHSLSPKRLEKLGKMADLLARQVQLQAAERMYTWALAGKEKAWGPEHTSTLDTVNCLGILYRNQGKLAQAEQMYTRALAGYKKALGPEHTSTLNTVNNLGTLSHDQGKLAQAEQIYKRALAGKEKVLGLEHTSTLDTANNLGILYRDQGKLAQAEQMFTRALAGHKRALGPEHISTLDTVNNLGNLYHNQGKLAQAEQMYTRALVGYEKALGPEHRSTLDTVNNLGALYHNQSKLAQAELMYTRALAGKEKVLGPEHTSTLQTVNNLGVIYCDQGKLAQAEQIYTRALAGYERALGPEHISTLQTVNNLGILYCNQGKLAQAEQMYTRALAGYKKMLNPEHTSTLSTVNSLGNLYRNQGKLAQVEQMFTRALAGYRRALGPEHTSTLNTVNNLGNLYHNQGKLAQAEQMYTRALAGYEKALGLEHRSTLDTVNNLGALYHNRGKLAQAEQMYTRALAGKEKALGPEHISTLDTVNNLGALYHNQGKLAQAEQMYTQALAGFEKVMGLEHTSTLDTVNNLGNLYRDQGKLAQAEQMFTRALAGKEKALGPEYTPMLDSVNSLGVLYKYQGKMEQAKDT